MSTINILVVRGTDVSGGSDSVIFPLVVSIVVLVTIGLLAIAALMFLRYMRNQQRQAELPLHEKRQPNARRLTITTSTYGKRESHLVIQEKQDLMANSSSPPASPVPEIRITFPDEVDDAGKRQSGRVVVVRVGDHSVGLEPLQEDLPPYQRHSSDRFDSLDLDRMGGLKEKCDKDYY
ncbi:hypothetical protein BU24DRAFT_422924 [Aaosphaeria arxii CBS 175.79]|uniref:Uncharacterized protein n=1 Tax=Aaosphaeria arxii CBS 175.79 TaxID=1450172 RepID=A0A6A5XTP7_9PLEO|nr:uncharacterized protein BU24DRAFT_422924 [Aaosphaeria arxii CBS 175.79]KAF2016562.1 hypothetical protein BU24DRAFT_422924 [Aaosphaeria arxii CBS 175.79]